MLKQFACCLKKVRKVKGCGDFGVKIIVVFYRGFDGIPCSTFAGGVRTG
jgi:hypothetical protein